MSHFHGPVPIGDSYVTRSFERELVQHLTSGNWVLLLGPRQHGKTSALVRVRKALFDANIAVATVDLQKMPPFEDYGALVLWFANEVAGGFGIAALTAKMNSLSDALKLVVPEGNGRIVVLVDEASALQNDEWRNAMFGQIRAISSERSAAGNDELSKRVTFAFAGTFRPEKLVAEANSPFNVCEKILPSDLTLDEIIELAGSESIQNLKEVAAGIFEEVGGQPYLVQRLLFAAKSSSDEISGLTEAAQGLQTSQDDHVSHIFRRVLADTVLVEMVSRVVRDGFIQREPGSDDQRYLVVLGLMGYTDNGKLVFRNKLYQSIASNSPQFNNGVVDAIRPRANIFAFPQSSFAHLADIQYREIAYSAQRGAVASYNGGANRLALAGFGACLEAILLDYLTRQSAQNIAVANGGCNNKVRHHVPTDPSTWTLANMMAGARTLTAHQQIDIPENLRDWRNLIHPAVATTRYVPDDVLAPEAAIASTFIEILIRDLPK